MKIGNLIEFNKFLLNLNLSNKLKRFLRHQKFKEFWLEEKQKEKQKIADLLEQEILNECKTIKKSRDEIESFVQRMYNEAEKRQIKFQKKINKMNENEINMDDFISSYGENHNNNHSKSLNNYNTNSNYKNKKQNQKYQFQVFYKLISYIFY